MQPSEVGDSHVSHLDVVLPGLRSPALLHIADGNLCAQGALEDVARTSQAVQKPGGTQMIFF